MPTDLRELSAPEDLEGGVTPYVEPPAGVLACLSAVHLDQVDRGVVAQQRGGSLVELGLQPLAVAAPVDEDKIGSVEFSTQQEETRGGASLPGLLRIGFPQKAIGRLKREALTTGRRT